MTVEVQTPYNEHAGNGVTVTFGYTFKLIASDDLKVYLDGVLQDSGDYSVSGLGVDAGGSVTFDTAPGNGVVVLLSRELPLERDTDYQTNGDLPSATVDMDFDRLWQAAQQLNAVDATTLRAPYPETIGNIPSADARAGMFLAFDETGEPIASAGTTDVPVSAFMATVLDDATAADARTTLGAAASGAVTASGLTVATSRVLGRSTAGTGAIEELTGAQARSLIGADNAANITSGDLPAARIMSALNASGSAPIYAPRAWCRFNGVTIAFAAHGNCSSVTDNGVGDYTINFVTAMPDANYANVGGTEGLGVVRTVSRTSTALRITTPAASTGTLYDDTMVSVAVFR